MAKKYSAKVTAVKAGVAAGIAFVLQLVIEYVATAQVNFLDTTVRSVAIGFGHALLNWFKNRAK